MIFLYLLKHQIIKAVRAPGFYKNVIANIFVGLAVLYFGKYEKLKKIFFNYLLRLTYKYNKRKNA